MKLRKFFIILAVFAVPLAVFSQSTVGVLIFTNLPATMPANSISNQTSIVRARPGRGLGILATYRAQASTNAATYLHLGFRISIDGTNYSTTELPVVFTLPANSTNMVSAYTNLTMDILDNFQRLNLYTVTNSSLAGVVISNIWAGYRF
jgi:hypothetical protein